MFDDVVIYKGTFGADLMSHQLRSTLELNNTHYYLNLVKADRAENLEIPV
jgi:hypothetical protein